MLSTTFFNKHILPTVFNISKIDQNDSIILSIKSAASKGIEYLLVMENDSPLGIVTLNSLLKEIDHLSDLSWQNFIDCNYHLAQEGELEKLLFQTIPNRYVLIQKNSEYIGIMDLDHTPSYYSQLLNGTISIVDSILDSF